MKPVLLGQAPARAGDGRPFSGPSGRKLCAVIGLDYYDGLANAFDLRNLNSSPQPKTEQGKGDVFDLDEARQTWKRMTYMIPGGTTILAAGRAVAKVIGVGKSPFFISNMLPVPAGHFDVVVIPHPSGISQWWNDPRNVREARDFLRAVITHE